MLKYFLVQIMFHNDCGGRLWTKDAHKNYECDACGEVGKLNV